MLKLLIHVFNDMKKIINILLFIFFITPFCLSQNQEVDIIMLPFSSKYYNEFSPAIYENGLLFCSDKEDDYFIKYSTTENKGLFDIYFAEKKDSLNWKRPQLFSKNLNSNFHEGPMSVHQKSGEVYFTRNLYYRKKLGNSKKQNNLGIFYTTCNGSRCRGTRAFVHNNTKYNVAHPAIATDGQTFFFSSDMKGGEGGMDIYMCKRENRRWSDPINLGPAVNTERDEVYPFYHPSGKLYFSSDGHEGIRKLDIYYTKKIDEKWTSPVLLKKPVNSWADDFGYISNKENTNGYFSSNRKKSDDIFFFTYNVPSFPSCDSIRETRYCITVYEQGSMDLDTTSLKYQWSMGDGTKIRALEATHCYKDTGTYIIQLNVIDTLTGDIYFNEATYEFELKKVEQAYISSPDTCYVNEPVTLDSKETFLPGFEINKYYWKFEDGERAASASVSHTFYNEGKNRVWLGLIGKNKKGEKQKECTYKDILVLPERKK